METVLSFGEDIMAKQLLSAFADKGLTFAAAESCTGGLVNARLTAVPGSSSVVEGGVVSYSNEVKMKVLGVRDETLRAFGAVSEKTAAEMAEGVRRITGADIAVSVTGIAGPGGATEGKPVGTVCFGVASRCGIYTETCRFDSSYTRDKIRSLASDRAISLATDAAGKEKNNA